MLMSRSVSRFRLRTGRRSGSRWRSMRTELAVFSSCRDTRLYTGRRHCLVDGSVGRGRDQRVCGFEFQYRLCVGQGAGFGEGGRCVGRGWAQHHREVEVIPRSHPVRQLTHAMRARLHRPACTEMLHSAAQSLESEQHERRPHLFLTSIE